MRVMLNERGLQLLVIVYRDINGDVMAMRVREASYS